VSAGGASNLILSGSLLPVFRPSILILNQPFPCQQPINQPTNTQVKEASKPLTSAVVAGATVVGEAAKPVTSAIVDGAKVAGAKLHEGAEAAKARCVVSCRARVV
jgi:hypothetical protein